MKANPLQSKEMVYFLVWILIINLGYLGDDFVDNGVLPEIKLCCSGHVRTQRRIYGAKSGTYKPV